MDKDEEIVEVKCKDERIEQVLLRIMAELRNVKGLSAIVLGGSRATGTDRPESDVDIGLYYSQAEALDLAELRAKATSLDDERREGLLTGIGEWGPGVNGGGWLVVDGYPVDLLYRDMGAVEQAIEECTRGDVRCHYQTGHPHAFLNSMYMGEAASCRILWQQDDRLAKLKEKTAPYPPALKAAMIGRFLFEAKFSLMLMEKAAETDDIAYIAGHGFRSVSSLNQVLFAVNERYCLNEKKAVSRIEGFEMRPELYASRVAEVFSGIGSDGDRLKGSLVALRKLIDESEKWCR